MSTDNVVRHVLDNGTIHYRNAAGELHREDGPAVVYSDGSEEWCRNGVRHREDGPAVVRPDGTEEWCLDDERHREDGPSVVYPDGSEDWYQNGKRHREDGPAVVHPDGSKKWYLNGERHRVDGPAVVYSGGTKKWYLNGKCHREDGPAVVDLTGNYEYWIDGVFIIGKTIDDVYCLERYSGRRPHLSTELVERVMSDKGFGSVEDFVSWLAFVVLGEEVVPMLARVRERGTPVLPVLEEYLRNHEDYASLPFSWWYPIVEGAVS